MEWIGIDRAQSSAIRDRDSTDKSSLITKVASVGAVSQQMRLLEDSLGLSLTFKVGKRIRLTAAG